MADAVPSIYPVSTDPSLPHNAAGARERARNQIYSIWSDRLQLVSVLSTFSTSIDSLLFSLSTNLRNHTNTGQLMLAAFAGALVFHAAAAILAFLGAFVLIRYKLADARAHMPTAIQAAPAFTSPSQYADDLEKARVSGSARPSTSTAPLLAPPAALTSADSQSSPLLRTATFIERLLHNPLSLSPDITIELVRPFAGIHRGRDRGRDRGLGDEPSKDGLEKDREALGRLLLRCHRACSLFVLLGFTLLIIGVVSFAWAVLDRAVSIFVSATVAFSLAVAVFVLH